MPDYPNTTKTALAEAQQNLIDRPDRYVHYAAALRLGDSLAGLERYQDKPWSEIEPQARREWEEKHDRPWDEFAEVVYQAWAKVRPQFVDDPTKLENPKDYEAIFHRHYQKTFAGDYTYKECAPAYHLGYDLAVDQRLDQLNWEQVKAGAEQFWDKQSHARNWSDISEAVRYTWHLIREQQHESPIPH